MTKLQQKLWRWHFYAGLIVLPITFLLALSGGVYVLKPQIDQWQQSAIQQGAEAQPTGSASPLDAESLLQSLLSQYPEAKFKRLILPKQDEDLSVEVELIIQGEKQLFWLHKGTGEILHQASSKWQLTQVFKKLHGELLLGKYGSYAVELTASWLLVLILTGFYLHWPVSSSKSTWQQARQFFLPRLVPSDGRRFWRNLHGFIGAWFGVVIILFTLTGLPWTQVWGGAFKSIQKEMAWGGPGQEFRITLQSSPQPVPQNKEDGLDLWSIDGSEGQVTVKSQPVPNSGSDGSKQANTAMSINDVVIKANALNLAPPVQIQPPKGDNGVWTVRSMTQYRPDRVTQHFDQWTGDTIMRIDFNDYHGVKRAVGYGIALHEGALFGWLNQVFALAVVLSILFVMYSGIKMWWQRKPSGKLAAPAKVQTKIGVIGYSLMFAVVLFLPMVLITLCVLLILDLFLFGVKYGVKKWST